MTYWCSPGNYPKKDGGCGRTFATESGFTSHFSREHPDGTRHGKDCHCSDWWPRCRSAEELVALGWVQEGSEWRSPDDLEHRQAARERFQEGPLGPQGSHQDQLSGGPAPLPRR